MSQIWKISCVVASALIASAISVFIWKKIKRSYIKVGNVSKLFFYPVKSLKPIEVTRGICTKLGFEVNGLLDRSFMVINSKGVMLSQKEAPRLVLLEPHIIGKTLFISAPNGEELQVAIKDSVFPVDKILSCIVDTDAVSAVDCGDEAAAFFQKYLHETDVRLVRHFPSLPERRYTKKHPYLIKIKKEHPIAFQNLAALHIISETSLDDLNSKMKGHKVTALNFRPNILIAGSKAFEEDSWRFIKLPSGAEFTQILTTTRCLITTNDPETGILNLKEPLVTMRKYRIHKDPNYLKITGSRACMGVSHAVIKSGEIRVGEEIFANVGPQYVMVNKLAG